MRTTRGSEGAEAKSMRLRRTQGLGADLRLFDGPKIRASSWEEADAAITRLWPGASRGGSACCWQWWSADKPPGADPAPYCVAEAWTGRLPSGAWWFRVLTPEPA